MRLEINDKDGTEDPGGGEKETEEERIERERIEKAMEIAEIEEKTVFSEEDMMIDYGRKRATDCKHNRRQKTVLEEDIQGLQE